MTGDATITYEIIDEDGNVDAATVYLNIVENVDPINNPPIAINDVASGQSLETIEIDVLDNDGDPEGDALRVP